MPRQNRVTPDGTLIAVPDRGLFWGNRGPLLDRRAGWCVTRAAGPGPSACCRSRAGGGNCGRRAGLTELFFLDEATGLAAGHRPCGECRYRDYQAFKRAWADAFGGGVPGVAEIDARLHADRLVRPGVRRSYPASLADLPDGVMVSVDGAPFLVRGGGLLAWTPGGYRDWVRPADTAPVTVITPRATVAVLAAGYRPVIHPSAVG